MIARLLFAAGAGLMLALGAAAGPVDNVELRGGHDGPTATPLSEGGPPALTLRLAQAGSTGGTLGKPDQSLSGDKPQATPPKEAPSQMRPKQPSPPQAARDPRYLGCFKDQGQILSAKGRDLDGLRQDDPGLTAARCVEICRNRGFAYAGLQNGKQCYCGNSYGRLGRVANCDMPCSGNAKEMCGGWWANSIYSVGRR
jgi:hypothetical protein